ncbi:hypothetical protein ABIB38_001784 [Massilia sp. UYP11]|uniref:hypothetical protein n=1 Tax=Massilia sp. UYP11 TaxID=1756385 RepID=UPI003D1D2052
MISSNYEIRQLLVKFMATTIEARIKDASVTAVWNDLLAEAANTVLKIDEENIYDSDYEYATSLDELELDLFKKIEGFDENLELVKLMAAKRWSAKMSGMDFLIYNNFYAVTNFAEELLPQLSSANLKQIHHELPGYVEGDDVLRDKWREFFHNHPDLAPEWSF